MAISNLETVPPNIVGGSTRYNGPERVPLIPHMPITNPVTPLREKILARKGDYW